MDTNVVTWLLESDEPWTRFRTRLDLLEQPMDHPDVQLEREQLINDEYIKGLISEVNTWPGMALKSHNDASHLIYKLSILADFGLSVDDPGIESAVGKFFDHRSDRGSFQTHLLIPKAYGGTGKGDWAWMLCDAPVLLYSIKTLVNNDGHEFIKATEHLISLVQENGWRCSVDPNLGKFRGPGRKTDPCPIANVHALRALSVFPELSHTDAPNSGIEMLLRHWEDQEKKKMYLFGIGTDFRKLKYPFVWYDLLNYTDALSRFNKTHKDARYQDVLRCLTSQADRDGRYTAQSMYRAYKGWSFADKKTPSPWLTFLVLRIQKRSEIRS